jgi:hypothetical protein
LKVKKVTFFFADSRDKYMQGKGITGKKDAGIPEVRDGFMHANG